MDNNPKPLVFGGEVYNAPLADISGLSENEKWKLRGTVAKSIHGGGCEGFATDEEFETALTCFVEWDLSNHKNPSEQDKIEHAIYYRGLYYHKKKYRVWEKEVLETMEKDLADYALKAPHYDNAYLLELEMKKLQCMDAYFSHSVTADAEGNYPSGRWIKLCIKLLGYLVNPHTITDEQIDKMNIRNVGYLVRKWDLEHFVSEEDKDMKQSYGEGIYWRKAHRLYCHIREHSLHTWWN